MSPSSALLIIRLIDLLALGMTVAPEIMARYSALRDKVRQMVEEGRDPTPEEWAAMDAETSDLLGKLAG
jgi:hypothetical protein